MGYASATMKAIWNNRRAVNVLCGLQEVDADRIGVIGHSLGGHNAIFTALFEPRIRGRLVVRLQRVPVLLQGQHRRLVAQGVHAPAPRTIPARPGESPLRLPRADRRPGPRAFFTNSPLHDANFEVEGVRVAIAAARPVYDSSVSRTAWPRLHPDAQHAFPKAVRERAYEFLDRHLCGER